MASAAPTPTPAPATNSETVDPKNIIKARDLLYRLMIRYVLYLPFFCGLYDNVGNLT
jgi:hypothetical protein